MVENTGRFRKVGKHLEFERVRNIVLGLVSISLDCQWFEPLTNSSEDKEAAERQIEFEVITILSLVEFACYSLVVAWMVCQPCIQQSR